MALLDANVVVAPQDRSAQYLPGGGKFGPRVLAAGNSTAQLSNIHVETCGQAGLDRACVQFEGLSATCNALLSHIIGGCCDVKRR